MIIAVLQISTPGPYPSFRITSGAMYIRVPHRFSSFSDLLSSFQQIPKSIILILERSFLSAIRMFIVLISPCTYPFLWIQFNPRSIPLIILTTSFSVNPVPLHFRSYIKSSKDPSLTISCMMQILFYINSIFLKRTIFWCFRDISICASSSRFVSPSPIFIAYSRLFWRYLPLITTHLFVWPNNPGTGILKYKDNSLRVSLSRGISYARTAKGSEQRVLQYCVLFIEFEKIV